MIYELTIVLEGKATAAKKKSVVELIEKLVKVSDGKVVKSDDWGTKDFAYPIGKINSGNYLFFELELGTEKIKDISLKLKLEEEILRYLLVKKEEN
ncbi:30S ribosomal protein S6 [Patescibacteria group bacterium]